MLFGGLSAVGGLGLAVLLQKERRGVGFYRAALFVPVVFSLVATSLIWQVLYQPGGLFASADSSRRWLADPDTALYAVLLPALWRQVGYVMVLYLAGLKGIDPGLYEAATLDGATAWQKFIHVTLATAASRSTPSCCPSS